MKKFLFHGKKNICGDRIRMARLEKRLSQTDLARLLQLQGVPAERDIISRINMIFTTFQNSTEQTPERDEHRHKYHKRN